jgi:Domain of unknown function (DUF4349)
MRRITMATGAAALIGVVLVAACSHSGGGTSSSAGGLAGNPGVPGSARAATSAGAVGTAAALPAAPPASGAEGAAGSPVPANGAVLTSAALIRTAALNVEIAHGKSVPAQADRAEQIATDAGGQVYADERNAGTSPTADLTLKVPGPSLRSVLAKLSALGNETSRRTSTQDVTTQVADVSSRVGSAQASIDRLRTLFGRAVKVGDVIALESELSQREADLESLQAQQRALDSQTTMATVTLGLSTAAAVTHKHRAAGGFLGGLRTGWRAFASAAGGLATAIGAAAPFLVLALLVAGVGVLLRRRLRTGPPPAVQPPEPA